MQYSIVFNTPRPGAYRPPSDFGYVNIGKFGESLHTLSVYKSQMSQVDTIPERTIVQKSPARLRIEKVSIDSYSELIL